MPFALPNHRAGTVRPPSGPLSRGLQNEELRGRMRARGTKVMVRTYRRSEGEERWADDERWCVCVYVCLSAARRAREVRTSLGAALWSARVAVRYFYRKLGSFLLG